MERSVANCTAMIAMLFFLKHFPNEQIESVVAQTKRNQRLRFECKSKFIESKEEKEQDPRGQQKAASTIKW